MRSPLTLVAGVFTCLLLGAASPALAVPAFSAPPATDDERPLASPIPRETVAFSGSYTPGTIVVSTSERRL